MSNQAPLRGIHHITAISSAPAVNVEFYEKVLGLRLVKQTVNYDDPYTYHLYYGNDEGSPGTIITFFPWENARKGRTGAGLVTAIAFAIPSGSEDYWLKRLDKHGVAVSRESRFGETVIIFADPHGLVLELIATQTTEELSAPTAGEIDPGGRIRGFHSATETLRSIIDTRKMLVELLGMRFIGVEGDRYRFALHNEQRLGMFYDLVQDPEAATARQGSGTVHHIAFRIGSSDQQKEWQRRLRERGVMVTEVRDRKYFTSIYFHEPGGVLFEIATDQPGFSVDETPEMLGSSLMLPSQYESMRADLVKRLPPLRSVGFVYEFINAGRHGRADHTIVALHGTGGDERDLLPLVEQVAPGAAVISPRGRVTENGMNRFFKRFGAGVFDPKEIAERAHELADFLLATQVQRGAPGSLIALGYSNGANIAAATMLLRPEVFAGAILLRPMLVLDPPPVAALEDKEILLLRGREDAMISAEYTDRLIDALVAAGAHVEVAVIAAGHELTGQDVKTAGRWLARMSQGEPA